MTGSYLWSGSMAIVDLLYTHHITAAGFLGVPSNMVNESDYLLDNSRSLPVNMKTTICSQLAII